MAWVRPRRRVGWAWAKVVTEALRTLIADALADPEATWSLGGFGALATFGRTAGEPVTWLGPARTGLVTARGGIVIAAGAAIPVAYETGFAGGWSHAVALCLEAGRCRSLSGGVVAETGADVDALRIEKAGDNLFDLGLSLPQGRFGMRTADPDCLRRLRGIVGRGAFHPGSPVPDLLATSAVDLVVSTPLGRVEVFAGDGRAIPGPRGFVLPRLLALGRTHAATAAIPEGLVPVATLHPAHPCRDADGTPRPFEPARQAAFRALHARWGDPELVALKERLSLGAPLDLPTRRGRNVARVVHAQAEAREARHGDGSRTVTPR